MERGGKRNRCKEGRGGLRNRCKKGRGGTGTEVRNRDIRVKETRQAWIHAGC